MQVVLEMLFQGFSNVDIEFTKLEKLTWRFYTTAKALLPTNRVKLIDRREFVKAILDKYLETFMIYVVSLETEILIYPS